MLFQKKKKNCVFNFITSNMHEFRFIGWIEVQILDLK